MAITKHEAEARAQERFGDILPSHMVGQIAAFLMEAAGPPAEVPSEQEIEQKWADLTYLIPHNIYARAMALAVLVRDQAATAERERRAQHLAASTSYAGKDAAGNIWLHWEGKVYDVTAVVKGSLAEVPSVMNLLKEWRTKIRFSQASTESDILMLAKWARDQAYAAGVAHLAETVQEAVAAEREQWLMVACLTALTLTDGAIDPLHGRIQAGLKVLRAEIDKYPDSEVRHMTDKELVAAIRERGE